MHEPTPEFVARLRSQIGSEVRRRNREAGSPRWAAWSPMRVAAVFAAVVLVSMGVGGAVVAVAYEAQSTEQRASIQSTYEQRAWVARQRFELATKEHETAQARFNVGVATATTVLEKGIAVAEAKGELDLAELDLQEIRVAGRAPRPELSAPRVSNRDFVTERLRTELSVPEQMLEMQKRLTADIEKRVEIGTLRPEDLELSRSRMDEIGARIEAIRRKLDLRRQFETGRMDAVEVGLRALEVDAGKLAKILTQKIALAKQEVARLERQVEAGVAAPVAAAEANLRRLELETELSRTEFDLALIRQRIAQHRKR